MKFFLFFQLFLFTSFSIFSQNDSLPVNTKYWEDQLYVSITYNSLNSQPPSVSESAFSYGLSLGYIKDLPLLTSGKFAFGIGLGYAYDSFNHGLHIDNDHTISLSNGTNDKVRLHSIEFPLQIRWRNSTIDTYTFWRVYAGLKMNYNFSNLFVSDITNVYNINSFNKLNYGLELSIGYGTFNFYMYYGLSPMYKDEYLDNQSIDTKIAKFGLIFYIL